MRIGLILKYKLVLIFLVIFPLLLVVVWESKGIKETGNIIIRKIKFHLLYSINTLENILTTREENLESTKLPVYSLWVKLDKIIQLNSSLPESGRLPVKGRFEYNGKLYPVKVRYRGDMYWHWGGIQKSLRITTFKGKTFEDGKRSVNLINPEREVIDEELEYWLPEKMGILSAESRPIHLRLNNKYMGVYSETEQVNEDFIMSHNLEEGNIYNGDQGDMPYEKYENLWAQTKQGWRKVASYNDINDMSELEKLIEIINTYDGTAFRVEIKKIVDVDKFLSYIAFLDIGSSEHIDNIHNVKLYFKPSTGKFEPIVWDTGGHWIDEGAELIWSRQRNDFFLKLLSIPEFRERKNKILWEHLNGVASTDSQIKYINEMYDLIREDIYADKYKDTYNYYMPISNRGFDRRVKWLKKWVQSRNDMILNVLNSSRLYVFDRGAIKQSNVIKKLELVLKDESGITVKNITIPINRKNIDGALFELWFDENRNGTLDNDDTLLSVSKGEIDFKVGKIIVADIENVQPRGYTRNDYKWISLVPKVQPTSFNFFITVRNIKSDSIAPGEFNKDSLAAENSITGKNSEIIFSKEQYNVFSLDEIKRLSDKSGAML